MNKLILDLKFYPTKSLLLSYLTTQIIDMYGANYDAFIDALTSYEEPYTIELKNISFFENEKELIEVFEIIQQENKNILVKKSGFK